MAKCESAPQGPGQGLEPRRSAGSSWIWNGTPHCSPLGAHRGNRVLNLPCPLRGAEALRSTCPGLGSVALGQFEVRKGQITCRHCQKRTLRVSYTVAYRENVCTSSHIIWVLGRSLDLCWTLSSHPAIYLSNELTD